MSGCEPPTSGAVPALAVSRVLNSGAFLLARDASACPVVAPRAGALAEREGEAHVRLFGPDDFELVLRGAVRDLVATRDGRDVGSGERRGRGRRPEPPAAMAAAFADLVAPLFTEP